MMRALIWTDRETVAVAERPLPELRRGEALVKVAYCGICGSDLEEYWHGPVMLPTTPHPLNGRMVPLTLGHEASGIVAAVNAEDTGGLKPGDRVSLESMRSCGACGYCVSGRDYLCPDMVCMGLQDDGAMAEYVRVPVWACHPLPDDMSFQAGAIVEPLSVVVHAWNLARLGAGQSAVVFGAGMIGLGLVRMAKRRGVRTTAVEPDAGRRRLAVEFGAAAAVSPEDAAGVNGMDSAFECSGRMDAFRQSVEAVRKEGRVVAVGIHDGPAPFNPNALIVKQVELAGSVGNSRQDYQDSFDWVREDFSALKRLVGTVAPLERAEAQGFRRSDGQAGPKVHVEIGGDAVAL